MNDIPEGRGGETVFSEVYDIPVEERKSEAESTQDFRASGDAMASGIETGSWEEKMVATCHSCLSVRPTHGRAVLFYSQFPNGAEDKMSKHGGCPVLKGETKWAANLWVWNALRVSCLKMMLPYYENYERLDTNYCVFAFCISFL
jgi:hypothetical protein